MINQDGQKHIEWHDNSVSHMIDHWRIIIVQYGWEDIFSSHPEPDQPKRVDDDGANGKGQGGENYVTHALEWLVEVGKDMERSADGLYEETLNCEKL